MAQAIQDDLITNAKIIAVNAAGNSTLLPPGGNFSFQTSAGAITASLGADGHSVDLTPAQPPVDGVTVTLTVTYTAGSIVLVGTADLVVSADPANVATALKVNFTTVTTRPLGT
jgi:hypothetical protein